MKFKQLIIFTLTLFFITNNLFFHFTIYSDDTEKQINQSDTPLIKEKKNDNFKPGAVPLGVSIFPGILLHGAGHWAGGDSETAYDLLKFEGFGLVMFLSGLTIIGLSGASPVFIGPSYALSLLGFSIFSNTWFADIYGSGGYQIGEPASEPLIQVKAGYRYIYDPQFNYRNFSTFKAKTWIDRFHFEPFLCVALDDDNVKARLVSAYRIYGVNHDSSYSELDDSSFLDLQIAFTYHKYGTEYFSVWTGEIFIDGRYDMKKLSRTLKGSFAQVGLGIAIEFYDYDIEGLKFGEDVSEILLFRTGYGLYIGQGEGEIMLYYDHRKDDYVGGVHVSNSGGGVLGYFGLMGHYNFLSHLGVFAEFTIGSAYQFDCGAIYRL